MTAPRRASFSIRLDLFHVAKLRLHRWRYRGYFFFDEDFLRGTFPPAFRASDSPIAIACFLLVTFLPERPLFNVPVLRSCIAFSTFSAAFFPYLAMVSSGFANLRLRE